MARTATRLVQLPAVPPDVWLQRLLAWSAPPTLGRAAWRPQAVALAVWAGVQQGQQVSTVEQVARRLDWSVTLAARHLEVAAAAGLVEVTSALPTSPPPPAAPATSLVAVAP